MVTLAPVLPWIQIALSVALIALILLQRNEASLGGAFGGDGGASFAHKKRGLEKTIFSATIVVATLFVLSAVIALFV